MSVFFKNFILDILLIGLWFISCLPVWGVVALVCWFSNWDTPRYPVVALVWSVFALVVVHYAAPLTKEVPIKKENRNQL